jgi:hypothetical protein
MTAFVVYLIDSPGSGAQDMCDLHGCLNKTLQEALATHHYKHNYLHALEIVLLHVLKNSLNSNASSFPFSIVHTHFI